MNDGMAGREKKTKYEKNAMTTMQKEMMRLDVGDKATGPLAIYFPAWPTFRMEGLRPALKCDQASLDLTACTFKKDRHGTLAACYEFAGKQTLTLTFQKDGDAAVRIRSTFRNNSPHPVILNEVTLLQTEPGTGSIAFGAAAQDIRLLEQGNYWGRIRGIVRPTSNDGIATSVEPNAASGTDMSASEFVAVAYDRSIQMAFLAGFTTSDRWFGRITLTTMPDGTISTWRMGFDGGDVQVNANEEIALEEIVLAFGADPWALLEQYADRAAERYPRPLTGQPPVSWCSWYPYRLGVTEERVLENAKIGAHRLKPLGLEIMEVDLGWQKENLPCAFEENERFPRGLKWLADELKRLGFRLGAWGAPFTISEFDSVSREHPEWLVQGADGKPSAYWEWYWEPHGKVFILDLTHPGAQQWLKEKIDSLYARGVRYFKADFIGCASKHTAKARHNARIAAGAALEAARLGAAIIRKALPDALILNCGGPEMPGPGHWPLLYVCNDTGNTGFISYVFHQENFQGVACHLYKNRRWGIVQPSCLCIGLPGTLEDARIRATVAFLAGGQVDISDDLTTLPEDRWAVLTATLPPLGLTAKPIDLFEPIFDGNPYIYASVTKGEKQGTTPPQEHPPGSVWHLHVKTDWDEWDLVGLFCFAEGTSAKSPAISRYSIPLERLGISASAKLSAYEFWSGQCVGKVPGGRVNAGGYQHPGDFQELRVHGMPGALDIAFVGPDVKLLCLRRARPHPWVIGTSFHQSCGTELRKVAWNEKTSTLSGILCRPAGESGSITVATNGMNPLKAKVGGTVTPFRMGSNGSVVLPVTVMDSGMHWSLTFARKPGKQRKRIR